MNIYKLLWIFLIFPSLLKAQQVTNSSGNFIANNQYSLEYSLGEIYTLTLNSSNKYVTSGVLQPFKTGLNTLTSIISSQNSEILIYPNPTTDILNIIGLYQDTKIQITSITGLSTESEFENNMINLSSFKQGIYLLQLSNTQNQVIKTFKIIKL